MPRKRGRKPKPVMRMDDLRKYAHEIVKRLDERRPAGERGTDHLAYTAALLRDLSREADRKVQAEIRKLHEQGPNCTGVARQTSEYTPVKREGYRHYERDGR